MGKESYKVSVIVPIYKVEKFITRCADSLLRQTFRDVEFIFVNDATPDDSVHLLRNVIESYPERKEQIKLLTHSKNQGLPAARNTGLAIATGEYIFHCDSDDYVEPDMLEWLYAAAQKENADIVWCDWFLSFEKKERYMKQPQYATPLEALKGMVSGVMKFNVWNKLVRRSLYVEHQIEFPAGYGMGEDMTMIRLFARAKRVTYLPKAFYHYVQLNTEAFSKTYSDKHLAELQHNVSIILADMRQLFENKFETELAFLKLDVKFPFLTSGDREKYALWKSWYPEANRYIMQNKQLSLRSRYLQWLAWKNQFWAVTIYYKFVHRLVYGIIYY